MREAPCYGFYATSLMKKRNLFHPCQNRSSVLKNAYIADFGLWSALHLRSDFDVQIRNDEVIRGFSTGWFVSCNSLLSSLLERRRDAFIVHLAPNHRLLYELAVNPPVSSTQMHQGHGRSLGPVPSIHLQKPPWEDASPSHPAKARKTARQASGERPIWIASAIADGPSIVVA